MLLAPRASGLSPAKLTGRDGGRPQFGRIMVPLDTFRSVSEVVQFSYRVVGTGWSEGSLRIGDQRAEMTASYLGDALGELLDALVSLTAGETSAEVSWEEEPGEFRFIFTLDGRQVRTRVLEFDDDFPERKPEADGALLLDAACPLDALLGAVAAGTRQVLDEMGTDEYRARWVEHDFPLAQLHTLERAAGRS